MNKDLFVSMQCQLTPSPAARQALRERLSAVPCARPPRRTAPWKYGALAACAALLVAASPIYQALHPPLHSYLTLQQPDSSQTAEVEESARPGYGDTGQTPDQDQDMTRTELEQAMVEAGFSQADTDAYLGTGYTMTWAKWWKFVDQTGQPRTLDALLAFSREELSVNTGLTDDAPADAAGQGWLLYENLTAYFQQAYGPDRWPDWYGGGYLDDSGQLVVQIVQRYEPQDKTLFLQIYGWAGGEDISFDSASYSLSQLYDLQAQAFDAMDELGLAVSCRVDEPANQVELTLSSVSRQALAALARLDPADDAIRVVVSAAPSVDDSGADVSAKDLERPVSHPAAQPGGITAPPEGDDGVIAYEPVDPAPAQEPQIAHYDLLLEPDSASPAGADTPSYDPQG